jgi:phenylalanyl-tRNA synthetase alpha chain
MILRGRRRGTLGGRERDALGADTNCVEEIRVLSATAYQQLPAAAIGRPGAKPEQKNLLVRPSPSI